MMILMMFIISFSSSKIINMNMVVIRFLSVLFFISFFAAFDFDLQRLPSCSSFLTFFLFSSPRESPEDKALLTAEVVIECLRTRQSSLVSRLKEKIASGETMFNSKYFELQYTGKKDCRQSGKVQLPTHERGDHLRSHISLFRSLLLFAWLETRKYN